MSASSRLLSHQAKERSTITSAESIEEFPSGETMLRLIEANGFRNANAEPLTGGIVTIYTAEKVVAAALVMRSSLATRAQTARST